MENKTHAERLRGLRENFGLSPRDFAEYFGITYCTYSQWESGRREPAPHIITMMERILELEEAMNNRNKLQKRIETIENFTKVLAEAGMPYQNDEDVAKLARLGQLESIAQNNCTYFLFKDDKGYQACFESGQERFLEKEEIKELFCQYSFREMPS